MNGTHSTVTPSPYVPRPWSKLAVAVTLAVAVGLPVALLAGILFGTPLLKPAVFDVFVRDTLGKDPATWWGRDVLLALVTVVLGFIVVTFGAIFSGIVSWYERRVAGRIQSRIGPNRAGFLGFFIWICDAVKLLFKEDLIPADADRVLFRAAPYFVVAGFALTFVVLPFGESIVVADMNVGVVYVTSITALSVVGILLSGWSSNSKWALFGGMRSAAQVVSYEIPAGVAILIPIVMAGSLSLQDIVRAQGGLPWEWFVFRNPAAFVCFFILFVSQLAEANRTPFDLPEAESELVAGYFSEYSGFRFALYFLAEWGNIWVISCISAVLFLGGWQVPFIGPEVYASVRGAGVVPPLAWFGLQAVSMLVLVIKIVVLANIIVVLRWTLPRIRVDQMMTLAWKYLVPMGFACFVFTLAWQLLLGSAPQIELWTGVVFTVAALAVAVMFGRRVIDNIRAVRGDRVDLSNW